MFWQKSAYAALRFQLPVVPRPCAIDGSCEGRARGGNSTNGNINLVQFKATITHTTTHIYCMCMNRKSADSRVYQMN